MSVIIDRRLNPGKKSAVNRQRFIRRYKDSVRRALAESLDDRSIKDTKSGQSVSVPTRDISEPQFRDKSDSGVRDIVLPGNRQYVPGDRIERPPGSQGGQGSKASDEGEGLDEFVFTLSREEFLDLYFEDMALPDLVKTQIERAQATRTVRAGYAVEGNPSNISIVRSLRGAIGRRVALRNPYAKALDELEDAMDRGEIGRAHV